MRSEFNCILPACACKCPGAVSRPFGSASDLDQRSLLAGASVVAWATALVLEAAPGFMTGWSQRRCGGGEAWGFGFVPGLPEARDRCLPWPTAHSQPPAVARYSVPLPTPGEAQILDPRLIRSRISSVLPSFNIKRCFPVGMYTLPSATKIEPHV
jgi:hypothetical protein